MGHIFISYSHKNKEYMHRLAAVALEKLGEPVRGKLYRYALVYSILSANTYSPDCTDGHYRWCVANLNNQEYWEDIE